MVYKAEDTKLKLAVALKSLRAEALGDGNYTDRFLREEQAAAALTYRSNLHPTHAWQIASTCR